jgi:hypothetical protein
MRSEQRIRLLAILFASFRRGLEGIRNIERASKPVSCRHGIRFVTASIEWNPGMHFGESVVLYQVRERTRFRFFAHL